MYMILFHHNWEKTAKECPQLKTIQQRDTPGKWLSSSGKPLIAGNSTYIFKNVPTRPWIINQKLPLFLPNSSVLSQPPPPAYECTLEFKPQLSKPHPAGRDICKKDVYSELTLLGGDGILGSIGALNKQILHVFCSLSGSTRPRVWSKYKKTL